MKRSFFATMLIVLPIFASAQISVLPEEVVVGASEVFTLGVSSDGIATTEVRLVIPEGLTDIRPNVKPGWDIETVVIEDDKLIQVTEIVWTGGEIPMGQREEFRFSAQAAGIPTTLEWKAYQTYANDVVVAWDGNAVVEGEEDEFDIHGPAVATVIMAASAQEEGTPMIIAIPQDPSCHPAVILALIIAGSALALAISHTIPKPATKPAVKRAPRKRAAPKRTKKIAKEA